MSVREAGLAGTAATPGVPEEAAAAIASEEAVVAHNYHPLPVVVASAEGAWVTDVTGKRYLDCYNNVPSVGHAHPRVVAALAGQTGLINTHTRYLHEHVVELTGAGGADTDLLEQPPWRRRHHQHAIGEQRRFANIVRDEDERLSPVAFEPHTLHLVL